jgi:hypothetical protein
MITSAFGGVGGDPALTMIDALGKQLVMTALGSSVSIRCPACRQMGTLEQIRFPTGGGLPIL